MSRPGRPTEVGLISILTTVRNGEAYLTEAAASILAQTDRDWEWIVFNDGSTDGTAGIMDGWTDPRIRVFHRTASGRVAALRAAAEQARGGWIAILDADDVALPQRLAVQRRFLANNPDVMLVGSAAVEFEGKVEWTHPTPAGPAAVRRALGFYNPFFFSSVLFSRAAYEAVGGFPLEAGEGFDFEFLVRVAERYPVDIVPEPLVRYRRHPAQMTEGRSWLTQEHRRGAAAQRDAARRLCGPAARVGAFLFPLLHRLYYWLPACCRSRRLKDAVKYALLRLVRAI